MRDFAPESAPPTQPSSLTRREVLRVGVVAAATLALPASVVAAPVFPRTAHHEPSTTGDRPMDTVTTKDGVRIFFKDWGPRDAQPIIFHHGWPLPPMTGTRRCCSSCPRLSRRSASIGAATDVRARSRRHDMDHYAADAAAVVEHLDLRNAVHVGHSTGGGEVARYVAKSWQPRGASPRRCCVGAVPPIMVQDRRTIPGDAHRGVRWSAGAWPPTGTQFYRDCRPARSTASIARARSRRRRDQELVAAGDDGLRECPL